MKDRERPGNWDKGSKETERETGEKSPTDVSGLCAFTNRPFYSCVLSDLALD